MGKNIKILGYQVASKPVTSIVSEAFDSNKLTVINTINPHSYSVAKYDAEFRRALLESHVLIPDGSGIVYAARKLHGVRIEKIAGHDLLLEVMRALDIKRGKVFFLGSTKTTLDAITKRVSVDYPNIKVDCLSPPYKECFSDEDKQTFVDGINKFSPDVIFVGLTAPKQEKLIADIYSSLDGHIISGIGAVFDFYSGTIKRPNQFWLNLHLEWLVRLVGEPKRLWRRTFISAPIFLYDLFFDKVKGCK
ncbi:WecB/TagA/CpsF family glycosyltransferase [Vibrio sp. 10N.261.49.A5]|uniref:N-acetylglucosaminyldiphospho-UDP N-acetyl-beta-D-mannosaminyltransferase n=1 Tax=Vibrio tasmaniensis 1F-267 TaxID=1191324 RepID=A0ABX3B1E6_9VIBR|nr:WecB/TagA/CpsF family glycosyltransferase [Vibrio tasmaniensis]OEF43732.1 N-acetylglucosaminyldiphospho-UDP N-acetyl-beta-D-mannosaminyltransferase [Vibrio tasmaniensis 1F-267]